MHIGSEMTILAMDGALDAKKKSVWIDEMGDTETLLDDVSHVNCGSEEPASRELIIKLLRVYRQLTKNTG